MINTNNYYWELLVLLSGVSFAFSFAPYDYWFLAIVTLIVLFSSCLDVSISRATFRGFLFGLGSFGYGISWVFISIHDFGGANVFWAATLTLLFVSFWALFPALTIYLALKISGKKTALHTLVIPSVWVLIEYLRGHWVFNGFPWFQLGYSQMDSPLSGYIPLLGVYGGSFLTALTALLLAQCFMNKHKWSILPVVLVITIWGLGGILSQIKWTHAIGEPIKVTMIQGNIAQDKKWQPEYRDKILQLYKQMTYLHWDSQLIIWPESAVPAFYHQVLDDYLLPLEQKAQQQGVDLVISLPLKNAMGEKYNAVMTFGAARRIYKKIHLLPFGEYMPIAAFFNAILDSLAIMPVGSFSAGGLDQALLRGAGYSFGTSICYEDAFGEEGLRAISEAAFLVNVTNDGWFGDSIEPYQHLQIARMRAMETGRYLLRSTNNGVTAIIADNGRLMAQAPLFESTTLSGKVTPMAGMTFYALYGDKPVLILAMLVLLAVSVKRKIL